MTVYYAVVTINDIIFDNVVAYAKRSKVDVNEMKRDHFTTLLLKKKTLSQHYFYNTGISLRRRRQWETQIVLPSVCLHLF